MRVQLLSTGDELVLGQIHDTNAAFLARELSDLGLRVDQIRAVGDDTDRLIRVLRETAEAADLVVVTGGLGPTRDDITARAAADAFSVPLTPDRQAMSAMAAFFEKRGMELSLADEKQAVLPAGSRVLENDSGTAPGFSITYRSCTFFFLPGVPGEMRHMFNRQVRPVIMEQFDIPEQMTVESVSVFGLGESQTGERLEGFEDRFGPMRLSFRAAFPVVEVKIICYQEKKAPDISGRIAAARRWVISRLEGKVFSETGLSLPEELGRVLNRSGLTLAVAESCTGGLISHWITNVAGSSAYYLAGATTYANEAKTDLIGVREKTLIRFGAVDGHTALEMAQGIRKRSHADVAVSTTGIAGPGGGSPEKPVGTVCMAAVGPGFETVKRYHLDVGDRHRNKALFAAAALNLLIREIRRRYPDPA